MNFELASTLFFFVIKTFKILWSDSENSLINDESKIIFSKTAKIGSAIDRILKDEKIDFSDFPELISILREASGLVGIDFIEAALQIANASKADLEEAFKVFDAEFILKDKNKEVILETVFHEIFNIINSLYNLKKICDKINGK